MAHRDTYSPSDTVTREKMALVSIAHRSALRRGSRRASAGSGGNLRCRCAQPNAVGDIRHNCCDGEDIWVANRFGNSVTRVHASDGRVLSTWTGMNFARNTIAAAGFIYVTGAENPGRLYRINPTLAPGNALLVEDNLGDDPRSITFDGLNLWTANGEQVGAG